jgi:hypothetical protein
MNCPRCNAEVPASATVCVVCGTVIRPAWFSYLPAGAPSWPTSVPQNLPYSAGASLQSAEFIEKEGGSSAPKSAVAPKKSRLNILAIIGLLLLSILIGGGVTLGILYANGRQLSFAPQPTLPPVKLPTASASSTPGSLTPTAQGTQLPTPTAFQTGKSSELGITLQYPTDWVEDPVQQTSSGNSFVTFHPQQQLPVGLIIGRLSASNSSTVANTGQINQGNIQGFGSANNLGTPQILTNTPQHRTIGGISWDEQDATYSTSNGESIHVVSISVKHNKLYYTIIFFAPTSAYDEAMQKYYTEMLNTFKFTS